MPVPPLLSICVATMNRPKSLGATLRSFVEAIEPARRDQVEISIVDGSGDGGTRAVVEKWAAKGVGRWKYQWQKPAGFDRAFCAALDAGEGKFLWMFPDDDLIRPDAVSAVLQRIEQWDPDCIMVNAECRLWDMQQVWHDRVLEISSDRVFGESEFPEFFDTVTQNRYLGYVGAIVMRRECWREREKEPYFDTDFMPVGVLLQRSFPRGTAVIAEPLIIARGAAGAWEDRGFEIWAFSWPRVIWSCPAIDEARKAAIAPREEWRNPGRLGLWRCRGWFDWADYRRHIRHRSIPVSLRLWIWLICRLPPGAVDVLMLALVRWKWRDGAADARREIDVARRRRHALKHQLVNVT